MDEDLPILMEFKIQEHSLELKLDNLGTAVFEISGEAINTITLSSETFSNTLSQDLEECLGNVFEYEIFEDDGKKMFQFYGDYGRIENSFEIISISQVFFAYDNEDLIEKGKLLSKIYTDIYDRMIKNSAIYNQLVDKLKFEFTNDIEKSHRKSEFYKDSNVGKAEAFASQAKLLQKYLDILNKPSNL